MKTISKEQLELQKSRGKTVEVKPAVTFRKKKEPKPVKNNLEFSQAVSKGTIEMIERLEVTVQKLLNKPRKPWKFTVNRNKQGSITTVSADPIE